MAKALALTPDTLLTPQVTPKAATPARGTSAVAAKNEQATQPKIEQVPLQVRLPKAEVREIKIAAAKNDQTISEFMLACFHAYMKA